MFIDVLGRTCNCTIESTSIISYICLWGVCMCVCMHVSACLLECICVWGSDSGTGTTYYCSWCIVLCFLGAKGGSYWKLAWLLFMYKHSVCDSDADITYSCSWCIVLLGAKAVFYWKPACVHFMYRYIRLIFYINTIYSLLQ